MTDANAKERFDEFLEKAPPHECKEGCENGSSYYLLIRRADDSEGNDGYMVSSESHLISPEAVVTSFIQAMDRSILDSKPDEMPGSVAWTYGRELVKKIAEEMEAPGDVSSGISDFVQAMMSELRKEMDDE